jgi:hypothetical protein
MGCIFHDWGKPEAVPGSPCESTITCKICQKVEDGIPRHDWETDILTGITRCKRCPALFRI